MQGQCRLQDLVAKLLDVLLELLQVTLYGKGLMTALVLKVLPCFH